MDARFFGQRIELLIVVIGLGVLSEAKGGYLSRTGPPPLRFAAPRAEHAQLTPPVRVSENSAGETNAPDSAPVLTVPEASTNSTKTAEQNGSVEPLDLPVSSTTASDLLTVTPQMLFDYFTPASQGKNHSQSAVTGPVAIGFTPPMPKTAPSSRATYISK